MAKRFTDTDKWKKDFLKTLPAEYKLAWLYILDECDNAGIWHVEMDILELRLGAKLSIGKIRGFFRERIVEFDGGKKIFVPDFIRFQYGVPLNPTNNAHSSVIKTLEKYNLMGHISPSRGAQDMDMDMDMDKDKDKDQDERGTGKTEWERQKQNFLLGDQWIYKFCMELGVNKTEFDQKAKEFLSDLELKEDFKDLRGLRAHFTNWFKKKGNDTHRKSSSSAADGKPGTSEARIKAARNF